MICYIAVRWTVEGKVIPCSGTDRFVSVAWWVFQTWRHDHHLTWSVLPAPFPHQSRHQRRTVTFRLRSSILSVRCPGLEVRCTFCINLLSGLETNISLGEFICLSVNLSVCLLCMYVSIDLCIYRSMYLCTYLSMYLFICLSVYLSLCCFICS